MPVRNFATVPYIPLLSVRPAELRALEELPGQTKDRVLPSIFLRPWGNSLRLESSISRIEQSYGQRPLIIDLAENEDWSGVRPVFEELSSLSDASDCFSNWVDFIGKHENYIPSLQFGPPAELDHQAGALLELERGLCVRFSEPTFSFVRPIASLLGKYNQGRDIIFIIDFARASRDLLNRQAQTIALVNSLRESCSEAYVSTSASSFPEGFTNLDGERQQIFERTFFNGVREELGAQGLIYSDRGSVRAERVMGGGGAPAPRIDYPVPTEWAFYREEVLEDVEGSPDTRREAYQLAAQRTTDDREVWDERLRVWGNQMIERTRDGDPGAVVSQMISTAVRINIHLQQQAFFDDPEQKYDTDEEWSD